MIALILCTTIFFSHYPSIFILSTLGIITFYVYTHKKQLLLIRADHAYKRGDLKTSFDFYEKYLASPHSSIMPQLIYSYRLLQTGAVDKVSHLLEGLDFSSLTLKEQRNYYAVLALIHLKKGNYQRAITLYETIFNEKANQLGYETLGYLYLCGKRYQEALSFNQKAFEAYPDSELIQNNLGMSYFYQDLYLEAAHLFESLLDNHTSLLEPYYYYAMMLKEQGDLKEAIDLLLKGCEQPELYLHELKQAHIHTAILNYQQLLKNTN